MRLENPDAQYQCIWDSTGGTCFWIDHLVYGGLRATEKQPQHGKSTRDTPQMYPPTNVTSLFFLGAIHVVSSPCPGTARARLTEHSGEGNAIR